MTPDRRTARGRFRDPEACLWRPGAYRWQDHVPRQGEVRVGGALLVATGVAALLGAVG